MSSEIRYAINDFLSLRLEAGKTVLYVAGERFRQCKFLFLNLTDQTTGDQINSIDEAAQHYNADLEGEYTGRGVHPEDYGLSDEEVFFGHCSNLQAWAEHGYDTRLLHSNLAFPLLQRLMEAGDPKAKGMFKEEVAKRFMEGNAVVQEFLIEEGFMEQFTEEEFYSLKLTEEHHSLVKEICKELGMKRHLFLFESKIVNRKIVKLTFGAEFSKGLPSARHVLKLKDSLKALRISSPQITEIPEWIGELENLEELRIEYCPIMEMPESIGNLKNLNNLIISDTPLEALPNSLGNLSNLMELSIFRCRLKTLPRSLKNLTNLRELYLYHNELSKIPPELKDLKKLEQLDLEGNLIIEELPKWLKSRPTLKIYK